MIYAPKQHFLLVEIPYTGSAILREAFGGYANRPGLRTGFANILGSLCPPLSRASLSYWRTFPQFATLASAQPALDPTDYHHAYKFAFVRNPFDRVILMYQHIMERPSDPRHRLVASFGGLAEMVRHLDAVGEPSQAHYLEDAHGAVVLNFVGKFENLAEDFEEVCRPFGIHEQPERAIAQAAYRANHGLIPSAFRLKPSWLPSDTAVGRPAEDLREQYTPELRQIVADYYQEDFDLFGYEKC